MANTGGTSRLRGMHIDKDLVAASATPLVLGILADGESYGYAILKRVRRAVRRTDGVDRRHALPAPSPVGATGSRQGVLGHGRVRAQAQDLRTHPIGPRRARRAPAAVGGRRRGSRAGVAGPHADGTGVRTMTDDVTELDDQISQWRHYIQRSQTIAPADVAEMEDHLRGQIEDLTGTGLAADEAFLIAVKRMGTVDEISREFAREHAERLWKQLVLTGANGTASPGIGRNLLVALGFAIAAAVALKSAVTWLEGEDFGRNLALIVLPFVTGYLAWTRRLSLGDRRRWRDVCGRRPGHEPLPVALDAVRTGIHHRDPGRDARADPAVAHRRRRVRRRTMAVACPTHGLHPVHRRMGCLPGATGARRHRRDRPDHRLVHDARSHRRGHDRVRGSSRSVPPAPPSSPHGWWRRSRPSSRTSPRC